MFLYLLKSQYPLFLVDNDMPSSLYLMYGMIHAHVSLSSSSSFRAYDRRIGRDMGLILQIYPSR